MTLIGGWLRIIHADNSDPILALSLVSWLVFTVAAIYEIVRSRKINHSEKLLWVLGLIFMNVVIGIVYLLAGRKRVANAL